MIDTRQKDRMCERKIVRTKDRAHERKIAVNKTVTAAEVVMDTSATAAAAAAAATAVGSVEASASAAMPAAGLVVAEVSSECRRMTSTLTSCKRKRTASKH